MFLDSLSAMISGVILVLVTITVHELAHGYAAYLIGDPTAKNAGRLSLNPLVHLDPLGAILLFVVGFGWAKPVPINPFFFKGNRSRGIMLVSVAGPLANLLLALILALSIPFVSGLGINALQIVANGIFLNIYMALFNLIPIPPLDGSKILAGLIPKGAAYKYLDVMDRYGMIILLVLVVANVIGTIITPIAEQIYYWFMQLALLLL